ncbi:hypothetical protein [Anaerocellum danielii]|uniref:DUF3990 domain-containing protein n=1 Tax=Anaerocellum danielii TaxID=1387557 RepID=A0ABZ0U2T6_9FIRM|nr:hypothetical protein [Caldicellulosiruptor danielii]WPX08550.1 hypothetical protein SOJ16_002446 [Caldicellulosiruptor danielii]
MEKLKLIRPYSCTGYHGTTRESAIKILASKKFLISRGKKQWLGEGVYFFENDLKQAYNWCTKARKYRDWVIIKSRIEADTLLDLCDLETFELFEALVYKIKNRIDNKGNNKFRWRELHVIDLMYRLCPFDVVRAAYIVPSSKPISGTNIYPIQVQVCVKNIECIKSIEEVYINETYYC